MRDKTDKKSTRGGGKPASGGTATVRLGQFREDPDNVSVATDEEIARLAGKLKRVPLGLTAMRIAYVTDAPGGGRMVISGNKRLRCLKAAYGDDGEVPAEWFQDITAMSEAERHEFRLNANISDGHFDLDKLLAQYDTAELSAAGLDELLEGLPGEGAAEGQTDEDAVPEVEEEPKSRRGEVYQCGEHRLMCGDSTSAEDVARLMGGEKADIAFTSPPYNAGDVAFADGDMFKHAKKKAYSEGYQDSLSSEDYISFASSVLGACFDNCARFIFWNVSYNANSRSEYIAQIVPFLSRLIEQVAWKKTSAVPLRGSMRRAWEPIYVFSVNGEGLPVGEVVTNIWEVSNTGAQSKDHKACFPVALPEKGIDASAARSVLDPFCGTGTTIIAAEKKGIRAFGMELDPHYCDVIRRRWAEFVHGEGCDWQKLTPKVDA